jgi:hypothetical protein
VCHQSVGLISRALEAAGIPTVSLTSAWSITASVNPSRAAFVDHPLGHTSGKPFDGEGQRRIVSAALRLLAEAPVPGTLVDLGEQWGSDDWRADPMGGGRGRGDSAAGGDSRTPRRDTPQYQTDDDARLAAARLGEDVACAACTVFDA